MSELYLGIDTSCYTTSVALVTKDGDIAVDERIILPVAAGERGLRQSDGVFHHVRHLGILLPKVLSSADKALIAAVGVSAAPRCEADSYMPVFLCGTSFAAATAASLNVPLYRFSHQQGHIAAARRELPSGGLTAIHLSGGTTELVSVDGNLGTACIGGTSDLSAGQFVDRIGVALGLSFPAGKGLEALAVRGSDSIKLPSSVKGLVCSFSGAESRLQAMLSSVKPEDAAYAVYDCVARTLSKLMLNAKELHGSGSFLLAGGVASSGLLRELVARRVKGEVELLWGEPVCCSDNAVGVARLAAYKTGGAEVMCRE